MRRIFGVLPVLLAGWVSAAEAGVLDGCLRATVPAQRIERCTMAIDSGQWSGADLAAAYDKRGIAYYRLGAYERAVADHAQAIQLDPQNAVAYYNRGIAYYRMDLYDRAIADFDATISFDPAYARAFNNRGSARLHLAQYALAIADFDAAIALDPDYTRAQSNRAYALNGLARSLCDAGRAAEALSYVTQALAILPGDAEITATLAQIQAALGDGAGVGG